MVSKSIWMIIGLGPNNIEIPLVPFETKEEAEGLVSRLPIDPVTNWLSEEFYDDGLDGDDPLYRLLFDGGRYYGGCGGCYKLEIREVFFGKPMVGWDLD